jgi:hypothetical protein
MIIAEIVTGVWMMKEWVVYTIGGVALLAVLFGLSFCSGSVVTTRSNPDTEAEKKAQEYLERTVTKCGDSYYVKAERADVERGKFTQTESLFQLDSPITIVQKRKEPLTHADELNHVEWEGAIRLMAVAHREYSWWSGWSSWSDGPPYNYSANPLLAGGVLNSNLTKQNGQWRFGSLDIGNPRVTKPDCSEIPPG